jgi:hypothetical protein
VSLARRSHCEGRLCGAQTAFRSSVRVRAERSRSLQEGDLGGMAATGAGTLGSSLQEGGDLVVRPQRGGSLMPRSAVWIAVAVRDGRQGAVDGSPVGGPGAPVHGRPDQRVAVHDPGTQRDEARRFGGCRRVGRDAEDRGCLPELTSVGGGVCGSQQQQHLGVRRERSHLAQEPLLEAAGERERLRRRRKPNEPYRRQVLGNLDEGEGVPLGLRHDALGHVAIEGEPRLASEELEGGGVIQAADVQNGEVVQEVVTLRAAPLPEDERDPLRLQPAAPERQRLERLAVNPLCVVDDREQPLPRPRRVRREADRAEPNEEPVGRRPSSQAQRRVQGVPLRRREALDLVEDREEQAMEGREPELALCLDAREANHQKVRGRVDRVVKQGGLPDAGITPHDERAAQTAPHRREERVECLALLHPANERHDTRTLGQS